MLTRRTRYSVDAWAKACWPEFLESTSELSRQYTYGLSTKQERESGAVESFAYGQIELARIVLRDRESIR